MALEVINTGTAANSGDGDNLRAFATKSKNNFAEIYADDYVTSARIADDVALGGNPTTTTQTAGDNSTKVATTAYADNAVANAIDAAPAALDTLNELAASLNDDADFAGTMTTSLAGKLATTAGAVGTTNLADDAVTADKLANSINTEIAANTAKVTNATHTGEVTGSAALTIASDVVDADNLKVTGNGTSGQALLSDGDGTFSWGAAGESYTAGSGLDLTSNAFSVEADLRDGITHIGVDTGDYIQFTADTQMDFYVNGSNEMRLEADGDLHVDGDVIAASTTVSSDEKLKENIETISNATDILSVIKGVDFNWKKDGKKSSGVIAQDVQKVMPHLVKEVKELDSNDSHLAVNYDGLIGVLIEAVKDLSNQVNELKK